MLVFRRYNGVLFFAVLLLLFASDPIGDAVGALGRNNLAEAERILARNCRQIQTMLTPSEFSAWFSIKGGSIAKPRPSIGGLYR